MKSMWAAHCQYVLWDCGIAELQCQVAVTEFYLLLVDSSVKRGRPDRGLVPAAQP